MRLKIMLLLLLAVIAIPHNMWANTANNGVVTLDTVFFCGNDLYEKMIRSPGVALGYVIGVLDEYMDHVKRSTGKDVKVPLGVTNVQCSAIVKNFLKRHPEGRHLLAAALVRQAISEAFGWGRQYRDGHISTEEMEVGWLYCRLPVKLHQFKNLARLRGRNVEISILRDMNIGYVLGPAEQEM
jgi:hypothetical protein